MLVWQRLWAFVSKAGTAILAMAVAVWALSVLPNGNFETSFLVQFGRFVAPVGNWMGLDWRLTVALIASFPAKENAIAALGVIFGNADAGLTQTLAAAYTPASVARLHGRVDAVHPVRGDCRQHASRDRVVEVDALGYGDAAGRVDPGQRPRVPPGDGGGAMMLLEKLMARVRGGGTLETSRLAAELDAPLEMVEAMLEHLQRQGLISEYVRCTDGCNGCSLQSGCVTAPQMRLWQAGAKS